MDQRCCTIILGAALAWLIPGALGVNSARAQDPTTPVSPAPILDSEPLAIENFETPRGLAMGTGARASAASTSSHAYNSAAMPLNRQYHIEALVGYSPSAQQWWLGSAIVDSVTNKLAMGLSFRGLLGSEDDSYSGIDGRASIALPLADFLALGVGARYISIHSDQQGPEGEDGPTLAQGFTLDASVLIEPTTGFRIAAFGQNLLDVDSAMAPTLLGGGASYQIGDVLTLGADVLVDMTTFDSAMIIAGGGVEWLAGGTFPVRAGYQYDQGRDSHLVTGGLGYVDQKFGVDLSIAQGVSGSDETRLLLGVRYFVR